MKLSFFVTKLFFVNVYKLFLNSVTFSTTDLRESRDMAFLVIFLWKLLRYLPAPDLFPTANDRFSISSIFFRYKIDGFIWNLIASFPFHHE